MESERIASAHDAGIDYSDIAEFTAEELQSFVKKPRSPLRERTQVLRLDDDVFAWLQEAAKTESSSLNLLLKREAERAGRLRGAPQKTTGRTTIVEKAS